MKILDRLFGIPELGVEEDSYKTAYKYLNETRPRSKNESRDKLIIHEVESNEDAFRLADLIEEGVPVIVNFEEINPSEANKILWFISGVIYLIDGKSIQLDEKVFLFTDSQNLEDGSILEYLEQMR